MIFILHRNDCYVPDVPRFCDQHETLLTNFFDSRNRRTLARILAHSLRTFTRTHLTAIYKSIFDKIYFPFETSFSRRLIAATNGVYYKGEKTTRTRVFVLLYFTWRKVPRFLFLLDEE